MLKIFQITSSGILGLLLGKLYIKFQVEEIEKEFDQNNEMIEMLLMMMDTDF